MPVQHHKKTFSVGSNDKKALLKYLDRYAHSMGKCSDDPETCFFCLEELLKWNDEQRAAMWKG